MIICYRRHMTYLLLGLPLVAYLVLVLCLLTRVCPRSGLNPPGTESDFRQKYQELVRLLKDHILRRDSRLGTDVFGSDLRKLLNSEGKGRTQEHLSDGDFDEVLEKFVQRFRGGDGAISLQDKNPEAFRDLNVQTWHVRTSKTNSNFPTNLQDIHKIDPGYPTTSIQYPHYIHNCSSISNMRIKTQLGHGVSKQAFVADYQGTQVVIKMVTRHVTEVKNCLKRLRQVKAAMETPKEDVESVEILHNADSIVSSYRGAESERYSNGSARGTAKDQSGLRRGVRESESNLKRHQVELNPAERQSCYISSTARVMKEILLSQQLHHPNLASLLGYCVRSEESDTTDISEHGVISVFELGSRFVLDSLQILPWPDRLRHATEMASLLHYLEFSPIGSLVVPDFKEGHVIMANDSLKLIDLDDVNNIEPDCGLRRSTGDDKCPYDLRCSRALCEGFNAKENLKNMNRLVFKRLLFPTTFPSHVIPEVGQLNADLDTLKVTASQVLDRLRRIQELAEMQDLT